MPSWGIEDGTTSFNSKILPQAVADQASQTGVDPMLWRCGDSLTNLDLSGLLLPELDGLQQLPLLKDLVLTRNELGPNWEVCSSSLPFLPHDVTISHSRTIKPSKNTVWCRVALVSLLSGIYGLSRSILTSWSPYLPPWPLCVHSKHSTYGPTIYRASRSP